jgi:hypothetical protein
VELEGVGVGELFAIELLVLKALWAVLELAAVLLFPYDS